MTSGSPRCFERESKFRSIEAPFAVVVFFREFENVVRVINDCELQNYLIN